MDAKEKLITEFEEAWSKAIFPMMSGESLKKPIFFVEGGDYSYYEKFKNNDRNYLSALEKEGGYESGSLGATNLEHVLGRNFKFQDSKTSTGLQIVDVLANATQRALNNKLGIKGWNDIGSLMMLLEKPYTLDFVRLTPEETVVNTFTTQTPFYKVFEIYKQKSKLLFRDDELKELRSR